MLHASFNHVRNTQSTCDLAEVALGTALVFHHARTTDDLQVGNLGKIIGPLGLALIVGSSNYVSPKVTLDAIFPALLFLAFWYGQAGLVFALLGFETKGRSLEEINNALDARAPKARAAAAGIAAT